MLNDYKNIIDELLKVKRPYTTFTYDTLRNDLVERLYVYQAVKNGIIFRATGIDLIYEEVKVSKDEISQKLTHITEWLFKDWKSVIKDFEHTDLNTSDGYLTGGRCCLNCVVNNETGKSIDCLNCQYSLNNDECCLMDDNPDTYSKVRDKIKEISLEDRVIMLRDLNSLVGFTVALIDRFKEETMKLFNEINTRKKKAAVVLHDLLKTTLPEVKNVRVGLSQHTIEVSLELSATAVVIKFNSYGETVLFLEVINKYSIKNIAKDALFLPVLDIKKEEYMEIVIEELKDLIKFEKPMERKEKR